MIVAFMYLRLGEAEYDMKVPCGFYDKASNVHFSCPQHSNECHLKN